MPTMKRDQIWQLPRYLEERRLLAQLEQENANDIWSYLVRQLSSTLSDVPELAELRKFLTLACQLRNISQNPNRELEGCLKIFKIANGLLSRNGVGPQSRVAIAIGDLHYSFGMAMKACGKNWLGGWHLLIAEEFGVTLEEEKSTPPIDSVSIEGKKAPSANDDIACEIMATSERILLSGELLELKTFIDDVNRSPSLDSRIADSIKVSHARLSAVMYQDLRPLRDLCKGDDAKLEFNLWAYALESRKWIGRTFTVAANHRDTNNHEFNLSLARCYNVTTSVRDRMLELGRALDAANSDSSGLRQMLVLAAACRWLFRIGRLKLFRYTYRTYSFLGHLNSEGMHEDPLGLLTDIQISRFDHVSERPSVAIGNKVTRAFGVGSLTFEILTTFGWSNTRRLFAPAQREKRLSDVEISELVGILCKYLARFKGPVLKFGQIAATFGLPLPESACDSLDGLTDQCEPIPFEMIKDSVEKAYGVPVEEIFSTFEESPLAVGSIGQLHRATLKNGKSVAVKIKIPGIEDAIAFDLFLLSTLTPIVNAVSPNLSYRAILAEMRRRFLAECDFIREAQMQLRFRESWKDDPVIYIPEVHLDYCRPNILVTELIAGQTFHEFRKQGPREWVDRAGESLVKFVVSSCRDGLFNADPNLGNFLFAGGRVICLDFGGIKEWPEERRRLWSQLIISGVLKDKQGYIDSVRAMGIVTDPRRFDFDEAFENMIDQGIMGYVSEDRVSSLPLELIQNDLKKMIARNSRNGKLRDFPPDYVMGFRVYFGHLALVARLGSHANWSRVVKSVMGIIV